MNKPTRRDFLHVAALTGLAAIVQGCPGSKKSSDDGSLPPGYVVYSDFAFKNKEGIDYLLHLAQYEFGVGIVADTAPLGEYKLHFYEAPSAADRPIALNEYFVLTNMSPPGSEFTHVLRYTGHDPATRTLTFEDLATGTRSVVYDAVTKEADLVVSGTTYKTMVDTATGNLGIDQDGDGLFNPTEAPIVNDADVWTLEEDLWAPTPP